MRHRSVSAPRFRASRPPRCARCAAIGLAARRLLAIAEREAERHGPTSGPVLEAQRAVSGAIDMLVTALDRLRRAA